MRNVLAYLVLGFVLATGKVHAQSDRKAIRFDIPVVPDATPYLELLRVPGYAALALQNNGLNPSLSSRLVVKDPETVQIRAGVVRYTGNRASVYTYEAGIDLSLGVGDLKASFPVEVDVSKLSAGTLTLRLYPPLAGALPQQLLERIEFKIRSLADLHSQRKILAYLDRLSAEQKARGKGFDGMLEAIVLEAYNNAASTGPIVVGGDRGQADALSDQMMLLATLAIWLIGFPIFLVFVRRRRKVERTG